MRNSSVKRRWKARCDLFAKGPKAFDESKKHELSAAANRWIFVTPARMFLPLFSLSRILPAVMLSSGISNLLSYNNPLDASGGSVFLITLRAAKAALIRAAASTPPLARFTNSLKSREEPPLKSVLALKICRRSVLMTLELQA